MLPPNAALMLSTSARRQGEEGTQATVACFSKVCVCQLPGGVADREIQAPLSALGAPKATVAPCSVEGRALPASPWIHAVHRLTQAQAGNSHRETGVVTFMKANAIYMCESHKRKLKSNFRI